jgi:hypothetical protein
LEYSLVTHDGQCPSNDEPAYAFYHARFIAWQTRKKRIFYTFLRSDGQVTTLRFAFKTSSSAEMKQRTAHKDL